MNISMLVVTWNNASTIETCLNSVRDQSGPLESEVFVWDNASTDGTAEIVSSYEDVVLIRSPENVGFARAVNAMARRAAAPYLVLLNPDAALEQDAIRALLGTAVSDPRSGIVGAQLESPTGVVQPACARPLPTAMGLIWWLIRRRRPSWPLPEETAAVEAVSGAAMLISRDLWDYLGGFDERYPHAGEDLDLCLRAGGLGRRVLFEPKARVVHAMEASVSQASGEIDVLRWIGAVRFARASESHVHALVLRLALALYSASVVAVSVLGFGRSERSLARARALLIWTLLNRAPQLPTTRTEA